MVATIATYGLNPEKCGGNFMTFANSLGRWTGGKREERPWEIYSPRVYVIDARAGVLKKASKSSNIFPFSTAGPRGIEDFI